MLTAGCVTTVLAVAAGQGAERSPEPALALTRHSARAGRGAEERRAGAPRAELTGSLDDLLEGEARNLARRR